MFFLSGILLVTCFAGYYNFLVNVKRINAFIAPSVIVTSIAGCLYIAGIINTMPLTVYVILITGIILLIYYYKYINFNVFKENSTAVMLCFLLFIYLLYFTLGGVYEDGDSMTHWGIIVKTIFQDDRLPNFTNTTIGYQSYPPATACWIYFILKLFGYGEGKALFAQGFWMLVCVISMFSLNKTKSKIWDIMLTVFALFLMQEMQGLRVDIILSLVTIAGFVVISEYRNDKKKLIILLLPFVLTITLIKNSGLFFVFFILIVMLLLLGRFNGFKDALKNTSIPVFVSIIGWYLWQTHIKMVYAQANSSRHSFSIGYMKDVFGTKTKEDINTIIQRYISTWFSWNDSYEWQIIITLIILMCICIFICGKHTGVIPGIIIAEYIMYKICLLAMYLTNMPGNDALLISSYSRYQKTFSLVMMFVAVWMVFEYIIPDIKNVIWQKISFILIFSITIILLYKIPYNRLLRPNYQDAGNHRKLVKMINDGKYGLDYGDKVVVYDDYWLNFLFVRFTFDNQDCNSFTNISDIEEVLETNSEHYKYLVILEWNQEIKELLEKYGYDGNSVCIPLYTS